MGALPTLPVLWQDWSTKEGEPESGHVEQLLPAARPQRAVEAFGDMEPPEGFGALRQDALQQPTTEIWELPTVWVIWGSVGCLLCGSMVLYELLCGSMRSYRALCGSYGALLGVCRALMGPCWVSVGHHEAL